MVRINIQDGGGDTDKLSDLPDHILVYILEFIDIKHSVQTCVLSKRWKSLWKKLTNLTFHYPGGDTIGIFSKFVSQILSGRDNSLPLHSLEYVHKLKCNDFPKTTLLELIKYAASHNVQQLTVHAHQWLTKDLELPPSIFHCHSLTYLKLDFWFARSHKNTRKMFPKSLNLPALKTLHLAYLTFTTSDNGCVEPFSTCKMLSTLIIGGCYLQDGAEALCISNSNLSALIIAICEDAQDYKVVFCTPKLSSLGIVGCPTFLAPSASNLHFLKHINIYFFFLNLPREDLVLISWLRLLANLKIIILNFKTLEMIHSVLKNNDPMSIQPPCFGRLKSLKVRLDFNLRISDDLRRMVGEMVTYLLRNSPIQAKDDIIMKASLNLGFFLCKKCNLNFLQ